MRIFIMLIMLLLMGSCTWDSDLLETIEDMVEEHEQEEEGKT